MPDEPPKGRVFGYCRASTQKQVDSPDTQKGIISDYAKLCHLGPMNGWYVDKATSGGTPINDRTAGRELCKVLRKGDHLIMARLDRGFRSCGDFCKHMDAWKAMGVSVHLCDNRIDFSSPIGMLALQVIAAFSEMERKLIGARLAEGRRHSKNHGFSTHNNPGLGFKYVPKRTSSGRVRKVLVPDDDEREVMRWIAAARLQVPPVTWLRLKQIMQKKGLVNRWGQCWSINGIRRACEIEMRLRADEQKGVE